MTAMMVLALLLGILTSFRIIKIGEVLAISFLTGLASALNNPAYQALVPDLVEREDLLNAIALNSAQFNMSRAIGPTLAGLALGSLGAAGCFTLARYHFIHIPREIYGISTLPVSASPAAFAWVALAAMALCFVAALYPARQASKQLPVEVIRWE